MANNDDLKNINLNDLDNLEVDDKELEWTKEQSLELLKNSWEMYERTKADTLENRPKIKNKDGSQKYTDNSTKKTLKLLHKMQKDIEQQYVEAGGNIEDLKRPKEQTETIISVDEARKKLFAELLAKEAARPEENEPESIPETVVEEVITEEPIVDSEAKEVPYTEFNLGNNNLDMSTSKGSRNIKFDEISLPSRGEAYKSKRSKMPVAYLTAYDENMIISPNLYKDGTFLSRIIQNKLMNDEIAADDLLPGDRDAIILWLRASGYGPMYSIQVNDPYTNSYFDTEVDLSKLKYKKFTLKGDANGYFDFTLPITKDRIKFKFLTYGEEKKIEDAEKSDNLSLKKERIKEINEELIKFITEDTELDNDEKLKLSKTTKDIENYANNIDEGKNADKFTHTVTNRLVSEIVSINGVTDRKYIEEYVMYMNVQDSSALRKYIVNNEPGVDFNIVVQRPIELGGGDLTMFLSIDQFVFLN